MSVQILETGEGEWGLSLDGTSNPTAENYAVCDDRQQAERIAVILNDSLDMMIIARYFFRGSRALDCPNWGKRDDGHYGPCHNCPACRLNEAA